jgi:Dynamin family
LVHLRIVSTSPNDHFMTSAASDRKTSITNGANGALLDAAFAKDHDRAAHYADTLRQARLQIETAGAGIDGLAPAIRALRHTEAHLRRPLRIALMGEFNSGKSTLANLMIGNALLPTLQLSNTRIPTLIHYSAEPVITAALEAGGTRVLTADALETPPGTVRIQVGMPMPHLTACEIVDFPGFSDPWLSFGVLDIARHPIDAAIWCTFSTQAWKESECTAWRLLPARIRAHSILAVTSKDLLTQEQAPKVMARLRKAAGGDFSSFALLSSLQGRKALDTGGRIRDPGLWQDSGADAFCATLETLLCGIRQHRLEKARHLTTRVAGSALSLLEAASSGAAQD